VHGFSGLIRSCLGRLLGWIVGTWAWTWQSEVLVTPAIGCREGRRSVFAFWHGEQMALLAARRGRSLAVMVSLSKDGELQAGVMRSLGLRVVRGSSSRGATRGFCAIVRLLRQGSDAAFALDGPRGPRRVPKPGAFKAAQLGGAALVPVAGAASRRWVLASTWDRFELPLPFARVSVVFGDPVDMAAGEPHAERLIRALERVRKVAEQRVFS
jgi:lysophospholipid acyltransferase (LPLAT)-like uncharacterized protein